MKNTNSIEEIHRVTVESPGATFAAKVLQITANIPEGETLSYKQVAAAAGSPLAYRAVGNILNKNYNPKIPCHRVIKSTGETGGYNRGKEAKRKLLEFEKTAEKSSN